MWGSGSREMREQLTDLWRTVFGDEPAYTDLFFDRLYRPEWTLTREEDGRVASALYLLDAPLLTEAGGEPSLYLCAAATRPEYRGRGYMADLIGQAKELARSRGIPSVSLIPAEASLFSYYERFGFRSFFYRSRYTARAEEGGEGYDFLPAGPEELFRLETEVLRQYPGSALKSPAYFAFLQRETALLGGGLLKIVRRGNPLGYLVCLREGGAPYIKELMCPAEERVPAAGAFARSRGLLHIAAFGPAEQGGKPRGMLWRAEGFEAPGKNLPYIGCMLD